MRILIAHSAYRSPGGEDRYVQEQVELLSEHHSVELIGGSNSDLDPSPATAARMLYSSAKRREVTRVIDRFRPDVVHVHNVYPSLGAAVHLAAHAGGIPLVMTVHNFRSRCPNGLMYTQGSLCQRCRSGVYVHALAHDCFPTTKQAAAYASVLWAHRFVLGLQDMVSAFVAPSRFMQARLEDWGIEPRRVHLVRHFAPAQEAPVRPAPDAATAYGMFVGRLSGEKGLPVLLRALRLADDPHFLFVGDGPLAERLEHKARELGLSRTEFLGRRPHDEVNRLLADARLLALPSMCEEVAPLAALEAMAAGCPLVVSDLGALPEFVASGAGMMSAAGDEVSLSRHIVRLMSDDVAWAAASAEAAMFALSLTPENHLAGLEGVYEAVTRIRIR